jgi:hypothetical protein
VRKVSVIVGVADESVVPADVLSEIHMAFREFRDVQLEFVVVRQAPGSALSKVSDDSGFVVLFDAGNCSPKDVGRVVVPLLEGRADVVVGRRSGVVGSVRERVASSVLRWLGNPLFRPKVGDSDRGLRAFRRGVLGLPVRALRFVEVPISYREDAAPP